MKTIIITGSTDGIGKLTALKLANEGHTIYVHGRSEEKVNRVVSAIKNESNNENVKGFVADFSDLEVVQNFANKINNEIPKIDILINNAGIFKSPSEKTKDGLDIRMVVNYLAPYLLTNTILSKVQNSDEPRIINLSSAAQAPVSIEALQGAKALSTQEAYAQSKLALTMWSFVFSTENQNIVTIAVNPGSLLNTKMVKEAYGQFWSSADKGADILVELALSGKHAENNGKYFDNDKGSFSEAHTDAYNFEKINSLIVETNKMLNN